MNEERRDKARRLPEAIEPFRILIVEDEFEVSRLIGMALERQGYKFQAALDGVSALSDFDEFEPHLVLLDLTMPGLSGQEVYNIIRSKSDLPVLVVSALVGDRDVPLPEGVTGMMSKPFSPPNLARRVQTVLNEFYGIQNEQPNPPKL
ncbi:MAG TPA: response regulator [Abditibacteriaceae bacterium]